MKQVLTLIRIALAAAGMVFFFDGLISLYSKYALEVRGQRFILRILHDQPWSKVGIGVGCLAASLLMRAAIAYFVSKKKQPGQAAHRSRGA
jgi:hypothetical protein